MYFKLLKLYQEERCLKGVDLEGATCRRDATSDFESLTVNIRYTGVTENEFLDGFLSL